MQPENQQNETPMNMPAESSATNAAPAQNTNSTPTQSSKKGSNPLMWLVMLVLLGLVGYLVYTFGMDFIAGSKKNTELMMYEDSDDANVQVVEEETTYMDEGKSTEEITNEVILDIDTMQNDKSEESLSGSELNEL